jgi:protein MpaA
MENFRNIWITLVSFLFCIMLLLSGWVGTASAQSQKKSKNQFCSEVNGKFKEFGWNRIICNPDRWETYDYSSKGNPLLYQEFGFEDLDSNVPVNLVFCGVHGDEPTAIYQCFHMVREILFDNKQSKDKFKLVIAPIVNPDGFFMNTRVNANGIDVNRNLPTKDWKRYAHKLWSRKKDPRRYPGKSAGSEVETRMQEFLINKYRPDKILSFHAPLGFLDFDGPGDRKNSNLLRVERRAKRVGFRIEKNTNQFLKFIDFRFYPGSLGNYAGNDKKIPTYTAELPSVQTSKAHDYWRIMRYALIKAMKYEIYDEYEFLRVSVSQNIRDSKRKKPY